jgi:hypothetical protein
MSAIDFDSRLGRVDTLYVTRDRYDLNTIEKRVCLVVGDDNRRTSLANFSAGAVTEIGPPDFTAPDSRASH